MFAPSCRCDFESLAFMWPCAEHATCNRLSGGALGAFNLRLAAPRSCQHASLTALFIPKSMTSTEAGIVKRKPARGAALGGPRNERKSARCEGRARPLDDRSPATASVPCTGRVLPSARGPATASVPCTGRVLPSACVLCWTRGVLGQLWLDDCGTFFLVMSSTWRVRVATCARRESREERALSGKRGLVAGIGLAPDLACSACLPPRADAWLRGDGVGETFLESGGLRDSSALSEMASWLCAVLRRSGVFCE